MISASCVLRQLRLDPRDQVPEQSTGSGDASAFDREICRFELAEELLNTRVSLQAPEVGLSSDLQKESDCAGRATLSSESNQCEIARADCPANATRLDEVARDIALCDEALQR
jgi:hypothetical protein